MQTPVSMETASPSPWSGHVAVRLGGGGGDPHSVCATRSLRRPGRRHSSRSPPPPFRSCSIPIIPSVQCHHDNEVSCMQTSVTPAAAATTAISATRGATPCRSERRGENPSSCSAATATGRQEDEVALLLEEAQEQLRALALAHRKQEEGGVSGGAGSAARETVCFLNPNGGGAGVLSCNGPTQTQLLSPSLSHRDLGQTGQ